MIVHVIKSFWHKGLAELFEQGRSKHVAPDLHNRCIKRLEALDVATKVEHLNLPGFNLHLLKGKPARYSLHVNGPWCMTFEWENGQAVRVDLEQYH